MDAPQLGTRVRLRLPIGNLGDPGRLPVGVEGSVEELVAAATLGAGDDARDCIVVVFDPGPDTGHNGRRWAHPIEGVRLPDVAPEHIVADPHATEHQPVLQAAIGRLSWGEVLEVIG